MIDLIREWQKEYGVTDAVAIQVLADYVMEWGDADLLKQYLDERSGVMAELDEPADDEDEIEDEGDGLDSEPCEDDLVTSDYRRFYVFSYAGSKHAFTVPEDGDWRPWAKQYQDGAGFWGNIWLERERGGWDLLDRETGTFAEYTKPD